MQVQKINTSNTVSQQSIGQTELVSLNARVAAARQQAEPVQDDVTTIDSILKWIDADPGQFVTDPKFMSEQLDAMLRKLTSKDGSKTINSLTDQMLVMNNIRAIVKDKGYTELDDFFKTEELKLAGINLFMSEFLNQALYPTEENGGKPREL